MTNKLQVFNHKEFGQLRTVEINGEIHFVGKDVASILGYERTADAIAAHVDAEDKGVGVLPTPRGKQKMVIINESGLYSLIFGSKLPKAKEFKHWVTSEVLPSIRKTGYYSVENESDEWQQKKRKAELLLEMSKITDTKSLRDKFLKRAFEILNDEKPTPDKKSLYDAESVKTFLRGWIAKNLHHFAPRNGAKPPVEPERGFWHNGNLCIFPVDKFLLDAVKEGFTNSNKLLNTLLENSLSIPEKLSGGYPRKRKRFKRNRGFISGLLIDKF